MVLSTMTSIGKNHWFGSTSATERDERSPAKKKILCYVNRRPLRNPRRTTSAFAVWLQLFLQTTTNTNTMDGSGVTNYSVDKPSYGFTTSTTQFDDQLLKHGVINRTQTITAKGATVQQAQELIQEEQQQRDEARASKEKMRPWYADHADEPSATHSDDDDDDNSYNDLLDDEQDEVLQRYRESRLHAFQQTFVSCGQVEAISRDDWTAKVNQASADGTPVVICLTTTSSASVDFLEACSVLARRHPHCSFVTLPAREAMPDWPHPEPSLLVYRHGKLWREFFRLTAVTVAYLETKMSQVWRVVDEKG